MSETLDYTYADLRDKALASMKDIYNNIDSYSSSLSSTTVFNDTQTQNFRITGYTNFRNSGIPGTKTADNASWVATAKFAASSTLTRPAVVTSSSIQSLLDSAILANCGCDAVTDTVAPKGLLAFMNYMSWLLKAGTVMTNNNASTSVGVPCFKTPSGSYAGPKKVKDDKDVIKKEDFDNFVANLQAVASTVLPYSPTTINLSVSCCSSSCSSSSCSSSSSSSCSSSSSSSSSSVFIAFMKLC